MSARTMQNPGVELNEIDRSAYGNKVDNSLPNAPVSFVAGFANQGEDMTIEWINSKTTLDDTFGIPKTEFESYLYNAAMEILNRGGTCIASKLPYDNEQFNKYNCIDFDISGLKYLIYEGKIPTGKLDTLYDIQNQLNTCISVLGMNPIVMETPSQVVDAFKAIYNYATSQESPDIEVLNDLKSALQEFLSTFVYTDGEFPLVLFNDSSLTSYLTIDTHKSHDVKDDFILTLDANGGVFPSNQLQVTRDVQYNNPLHQAGAMSTNVSRIGYKLAGWYDQKYSTANDINNNTENIVFDQRGYAANGKYWKGAYSRKSSSSSSNGYALWKYRNDLTAYAAWVPNGSIVVTFDATGGIASRPTIILGSSGKISQLPTAASDGRVFEGWYDSQVGGNKLTIDNVITSDKTYYAHWTTPSGWRYQNDLLPLTQPCYGQKDSISSLDNFLTSSRRIRNNTIRIYDITREKYASVDNYNCVKDNSSETWTNECLGIVPVIVGAANAMYFQNVLDSRLLDEAGIEEGFDAYNAVSSFSVQWNQSMTQDPSVLSSIMSLPIASTQQDDAEPISIDSLSRRAALAFPAITYRDAYHFDKSNLKYIGVVVFKAFKDTSNSGKISFQLLESFVGSLDRNARDEVTHANVFIDDVVNQSSQFIRLFSNADQENIKKASFIGTNRQMAVSMGFFEVDCAKDISYVNSIVQPLTTILDRISNRNIMPIDIIADVGISNIAQLAKNQADETLHTSAMPKVSDYHWSISIGDNRTAAWKAILQKFDNLCKGNRKDCLFIADGLRPICLDGDAKIVRQTAPSNTVANTIIPKFRLMANVIDSSYAAGYCNWYLQQDYSNGENYIWVPPSIKAMGACIYCDTYFHPWNAPAGHTRGRLNDVIDVAFTPSDADAGVIYSNSWNYAMNYPIDGIVIEGHKTFQSKRTALDRINVRRLMLDLEKRVARVARTFVYEQNTPYTRQRFVDLIRPILEDAVSGDGISEYAIKCDDELNTPQVIENNEMRCKIGVKPIKVVDWIVIDAICVNQTMNVNEEVLR